MHSNRGVSVFSYLYLGCQTIIRHHNTWHLLRVCGQDGYQAWVGKLSSPSSQAALSLSPTISKRFIKISFLKASRTLWEFWSIFFISGKLSDAEHPLMDTHLASVLQTCSAGSWQNRFGTNADTSSCGQREWGQTHLCENWDLSTGLNTYSFLKVKGFPVVRLHSLPISALLFWASQWVTVDISSQWTCIYKSLKC